MSAPIICFGQQPCGFFPRRFLYAKIVTARRLQAQLGGEIVFFFHDSDHDSRETQTILTHHSTGERARLNFAFANKIQRKHSPLFRKRVLAEWKKKTARQLPAYVNARWVEVFEKNGAENVADFCLEMYKGMLLLEGIRVVRSSDPTVRNEACEVDDFFVDVPFEGEIVRARLHNGALALHEGGDQHLVLPAVGYGREQISPTRGTRLRWMQSVIHCTHYVTGAGEAAYLNQGEAPEIEFVARDSIDCSGDAFTDCPAG